MLHIAAQSCSDAFFGTHTSPHTTFSLPIGAFSLSVTRIAIYFTPTERRKHERFVQLKWYGNELFRQSSSLSSILAAAIRLAQSCMLHTHCFSLPGKCGVYSKNE